MKCLFYCLLLSFLFCFGSCGSLKKMRTISETVTITKIDTVIKYIPDTVPIIKEKFIYDTVTIETPETIARSYIDIVHKKIILSVTGKIIDIPVQAEKIQSTIIKEYKPEKPFKNFVIYFIVLISFLCGVILTTSYLLKKFIFKK